MSKKLIDLVRADIRKTSGERKLIPSSRLQTLLDLLCPEKCFRAFILDIDDPRYCNMEIHIVTDATSEGDHVFVGDGCRFHDFSGLVFLRKEVAELGEMTYYGVSFREPCEDCPYSGCECETGCAAAPFSMYCASDMPMSVTLLEDVLCDWDAPDPDDDQGQILDGIKNVINNLKLLSKLLDTNIVSDKDFDGVLEGFENLGPLHRPTENEILERKAEAEAILRERMAASDSERLDGLPHLVNPVYRKPARDAGCEELPYIE